MLDFAPLNDFTAMLLSERTEAAARQLARSLGFDAMRRAAETLQRQGLISEDCAAHLILDLMCDLSLGQDQVQRMERLGIDVPDEIAAPPLPGLQAVFTHTDTRVTLDVGDPIAVNTDTGDGHEYVESAGDGDDEDKAFARGQRLERMEQLRAAKRRVDGKNGKPKQDSVRSHTKPPDGEEEQKTCPICGEPISRQAVGCRKHWRQVKRGELDATA